MNALKTIEELKNKTETIMITARIEKELKSKIDFISLNENTDLTTIIKAALIYFTDSYMEAKDGKID